MKANRKKLELAMARACMNTEDLVKTSAMPRPTVNNVIVGRDVRPATLGRVARALDVDVTDILEDEE
nr:MAG TPA: SOS-response transcriptional repressor [Caudoviricetes sp.]